jgi:ribose transport system ATP-binding protein
MSMTESRDRAAAVAATDALEVAMDAGEDNVAIAVAVKGLSKVYPGTRALDGVDLTVRQGEVHALVGGNGCGKSTLIKIISGVVPGDSGTVRFGDVELDVADITPKGVHALGLRVVHQDLAVFPDLSVAENIGLGAGYPLRRGGSIDWGDLRRRTIEVLERFEVDVHPSDLLRDLPVAKRAQVAIARALQDVRAGHGLVILDEPTASLPVHEAKILHSAIKKLAQSGFAVLFVSHRLDEVLSLTDRVTILRDGQLVATHDTARLTEQELIEAILGSRVEEVRSHRTFPPDSPVILDMKGVWAGPIRDIDLTVRAGEVVGIAGLLGSGRSELLRTVYGDLPSERGTITVNGRDSSALRKDEAISRGIVMIPEDRSVGGIFPTLTLDENVNANVLRRYWRFGFLRRPMKRDAATLRAKFKVKAPNGEVLITALSGGNQQKAVLARWLRREPVLLLLDEPTQGVDVGARAEIYAAVRSVTDAGGAAVVVASDLEELAQVVDRAIVLRNGMVITEVAGDKLTAQHLNELIYTASQARPA